MDEKKTMGTSFRITTEANDKFKSIISEFGFGNQAECMDNLLAAFELQQARNLIPSRSKEIEEFADHVKRLNDIYLNALELNVNAEDFIRKEYSNKIETQQGVIANQQEQIVASKATIAEITTQLKESQKSLIEAEKVTKNAEAQVITQTQLIAEYKEKNDILSTLITKNQTELDAAEKVKNDLIAFKIQSEVDKAELVKKHEKELANLSIQAEKIAVKHGAELERAGEKKEVALEKLRNELQAEYQNQLIAKCDELQIKYQDREQAIHDLHNNKIADLFQKMQQPQKIEESKTPMENVMAEIEKNAPDLIVDPSEKK